MKMKDCMKQTVYAVSDITSIRGAAKMFVENHIGSLPVIDSQRKLVGLLRLHDLLELVLPDFLNLLDNFDFVSDFGEVEARRPSKEVLARPASSIMLAPIAVEAESGLLHAFSLLHKHQLYDLPVVDEKKVLVGIASLVDIGTAFIASWNMTQGGTL
jgi:CBS-domain-containing membrane protein